ncbi:DUF4845 domain-containing protein [Methylocaldum szegediense]|mgnify:CR=1 FL=1|uniref:DUF4845 domain-containing protein n=1 Tax=Methylocaldum szegediense TaxID=73780 RepID=A0ABN8X009_9GAMM|nr:DUF4845 domain-containing protein [Methylocaldum szegediense]CAI8776386.1 conserved protein of unknown function [Methylocaldum szegediense]
MVTSSAHQNGLTLIGFLWVAFLIGFFSLLVLKIGPIYLEHYKVVSSLESLKKENDIASKSREEILSLLQKRWEINMVERVTAKDVKIIKNGSYLKVEIAYDVAQHLFGNVDALLHFDDLIEVGAK